MRKIHLKILIFDIFDYILAIFETVTLFVVKQL